MSDPFEEIAGHPAARRLLASQLEAGRLAHAYLFVGERSLGKTTVARALARALLPEVPLERHPDYWEDDRRDNLRIDEVRLLPDRQPEHHQQSLQAFLSLKPGLSEHRVALITNVGRMADPIQGILLKTLEEPVQFAMGSWQLHLRRRMVDDPTTRKGRWARLLELSYDTLGYLEQNVSPRLALECFLLEARRADGA